MESSFNLSVSLFLLLFAVLALCIVAYKSNVTKTILDLKEENTLMKRAINDAIATLCRREKYTVLEYGLKETSWLFKEIYSILDDFEKIQQPTNQTGNSNNCANELPI